MSLSSASTLTEIKAAFDDNADYDVVTSGGTAKARTFIQAGRMLLHRVPQSAYHGSDRVDVNLTIIERQVTAAASWLATQSDNANATVGMSWANATQYRGPA